MYQTKYGSNGVGYDEAVFAPAKYDEITLAMMMIADHLPFRESRDSNERTRIFDVRTETRLPDFGIGEEARKEMEEILGRKVTLLSAGNKSGWTHKTIFHLDEIKNVHWGRTYPAEQGSTPW